MARQRVKFSFKLCRQAIKIRFATTVGHDNFYFSLKSSVTVVLNYGNTNVSCKSTESGQSERAFGVQKKPISNTLQPLDSSANRGRQAFAQASEMYMVPFRL